MALDPVILNQGSGGDSIGTDNISGINYEVVKQSFGAIGTLVLVSDAEPLPVKNYSGGSAVTSVADNAASVTLLAANVARRGASVYNDSGAVLYLKCGAAASLTSFTVLLVPNAYFEVPFGYIGVIDGIWASAAGGAARITEFI